MKPPVSVPRRLTPVGHCTQHPVRVMVVDDSALVRRMLSDVLNADPAIEVVAQAMDPVFAMKKMEKCKPDVITLDIEMPRMDGLTFLRKLMTEYSVKVVMCSSLTRENAQISLQALRLGAVDVISKPTMTGHGIDPESAILVADAIKAAACARTHASRTPLRHSEVKRTADAILAKPSGRLIQTTDRVIAIGASTGGTEALRQVLAGFPADSPGIVVVQHMPEKFTRSFAAHLNEISPMEVREAQDGDRLYPGRALIAQGGKHLLLKRSGAQYKVEVLAGPLVTRHRPSVDVLFRSVARFAGNNAVACIMTGMGDDGAAGLLELRQSGARCFAQDEATSVVFGMPQVAWKRGAAEALVALPDIADTLLNTCVRRQQGVA